MDLKDQIKQYISIVDVASLYVNLKPSGKNFKSLCPFHTEKTPSFFVMPDKNTFSCFGCNRFGDAFTLVQEMENIGFVDSIRFLIEKFNIPVEQTGEKFVKKDDYLQINELALNYFKKNLLGSPEGKKAGEYLKRRNIQKETIDRFALGYACNQWDGLYRHLTERSADIHKAVELGLLVKNDRNQLYDRFRGRIIFPIFSESGAVLAFGGRTIFDDPAKYLNSPDTPVYRKGNHLYGFHLAKETIRQKKSSILVEGYLDMVSLFQAGITQTVASLGTALTEKQIYILKRFADDIYIFYDSDKAGMTATLRSIGKMVEQDIIPRIIVNTQGKDPDEFIRTVGAEKFDELLKRAEEYDRFFIEKFAGDVELQNPKKKKEAVEGMKELIRTVGRIQDSSIRIVALSRLKQRAAKFFDIDPKIWEEPEGTPKIGAEPPEKALSLGMAERVLLESLLTFPDLIREVREFFTQDILALLNSRNLIRQMVDIFDQEGDLPLAAISRKLNEPEKTLLNKLSRDREGAKTDRATAEKRVAESIISFQNKVNKKRMSDINREILVSEKESNWSRVQQLMKIKNEFVKVNGRQGRGGSI